MASYIRALVDKGIASPPKWLPGNIHYETIMGSLAYGVASDSSDLDLYGFAIPPKDEVFPHLRGEIIGFGRQRKRFDQYQEHHLNDPSARGGKGQSYDVQIYSIVKYFHLCMECNPNMIDSMFTPDISTTHLTSVGVMVRERRHLFLSKIAWHKFKGYAYSQLHKMASKTPQEGSKRWESVQKHGFDVKFAYHLVRLLLEIEQILMDHDLVLNRKDVREHLKAIRRGDISEAEIRAWASDKEAQLERVYTESKLRHKPAENEIKELLLECLEHHYGSLAAVFPKPDQTILAVREIRAVLDKFGV